MTTLLPLSAAPARSTKTAAADEAIAAALALGMTQARAAAEAHCSERTVRNRLADSAFRERVDELRAQHIQRTIASLGALGPSAVHTLGELMRSAPPYVRQLAARSVLELGQRLREGEQLEARLRALEERLGTTPLLPWRSSS